MFEWLKRKSREEVPEYAAIRKLPNPSLPADLKASEWGEAHIARREAIERSLRESTPDDALQFFTLIPIGKPGIVTMNLPDGAQCLPVFSSIFRAGDYKRTLLAHGPRAQYLAKTPVQMHETLDRLREMGIEQFALDLCPRCGVGAVISSASIKTPEQVITCWMITRAGDLARLDLYLDYALACARGGKRTVARDVAFATAAHVGFEDPRVHFLLGQVAVALDDRDLLREAKAFLRFLRCEAWEEALDDAARTGTPVFEFPNVS